MPKKDIKLSNQTQKIMSCINDPCGDASVVVHFPLHEKTMQSIVYNLTLFE